MPAEAAHAQKKAQSADAGDCVRHTVRQNRHDRTAAAQYTAETCPKPAARRGYGSSSAAAAAAAERAGRKGTGTAKAENAAKTAAAEETACAAAGLIPPFLYRFCVFTVILSFRRSVPDGFCPAGRITGIL